MKRSSLDEQRVEYKKNGYALIKYDNAPIHSYPYDSPWLDEKEFSRIYKSIRRHTLVDRNRCYALYLLAQQTKKIPGNILEVGTWRGGTAGIFTKTVPDKTVYLADTFEGVVKSSSWEHYVDGAHSDASEEGVKELLDKKLKVSNYKILKGVFPEDTGHFIDDQKFSLVYLDLDVYKSTKDAFEYVWDKVSKYGIVVFDDYGMLSACPGIAKFINEIKNDKDKLFIQNLNGQACIVKCP
ncbi:MAG TPA: TylF/MycF/NovP-related O-methyltransferase [Candidatus Sulfotelmatobacter sp.]|nr:TylF/MycF/NovP-related O-methyltransferase [Candidatus Sulfotelmatobacter sp.]